MLSKNHQIDHNKAIKAMRTITANFKILAEESAVVAGAGYVFGSAFSSPSHFPLDLDHFSPEAHSQFGAVLPDSIHMEQALIHWEEHMAHPSAQAKQDFPSWAAPYPFIQEEQVSAAEQLIQLSTVHLVQTVDIKPYPSLQVMATLRAEVQVFIPSRVAVHSLQEVSVADGP